MKDVMFDKYVNLIRSRAWYYSNLHKVEYEEVEAQGFLIYCKCLEDFDVTKSGFSTHLYIELNRLNDFCRTYNRQKGVLLEDMSSQEYQTFRKSRVYASQIVKDKFHTDTEQKVKYELVAKENNETQEGLLKFAKDNLSLDAYSLLSWIVKRTWDNFHINKPSIRLMCEKLNWERERVLKAFNECKEFWNNEGLALYC